MFTFWLLLVQIQVVVYSASVPHIECPNESSNVVYLCQRKECNETVIDENLFQNIADNSAMIFCSKSVILERVIHINNKSEVSLYGFPGMYTEINCRGTETGFQFFNVFNSHFHVSCSPTVEILLRILRTGYQECGFITVET
jgi:hypothetical protein